jgi:HAD superfamily hydrolase (TIGR01509 family)
MPHLEESNIAISEKISKVKEVLFDFEGTLVDFQWQLEPAVAETLEALSNAGLERQWYGEKPGYANIYNHTLDLVDQGKGQGSSVSASALLDTIYDRYDADALTRWKLYPDTLKMLGTLRHQGFRMAVVSNVGKRSLKAAMEKLQLSHLIQVVVSRNDVFKIKPHPEGLLTAAKALRVKPAEVLFVGDSRNDVGAARQAGMQAGYLRGGEDSQEAMALFPADIELDKLLQLPPILAGSPDA